ncbi:hypothetical protein [Bradyrhizobium japonicum]|uniref:hypothetical protein n=1 Tax=Bradyrhizobium japonicum TaxID=375 RepID=UPI0027145C47|nr:hypothetical protein [Bradyrhizobium japonicum]WLB57437.1 hypothetical protein QIH94_16035 [Bradyrhizobium japonicum]
MTRFLAIPLLLASLDAHTAGPILRIGTVAGLPGCKVFIMPNGRQWRAQSRDITAGGKCPADFMSGRLIARNQVRLGNGAVCTFNETGNGTCR